MININVQLAILLIACSSCEANEFEKNHEKLFNGFKTNHTAIFEKIGNQLPTTIGRRIEPGSKTFASDEKIIVQADSNGQFFVEGSINGKKVDRMLLDTGASVVTISGQLAGKIGISVENASPVTVNTASGTEQAFRVFLESIQINDIFLAGSEAVITRSNYPIDPLVGMSALSQFDISIAGNQLTLQVK